MGFRAYLCRTMVYHIPAFYFCRRAIGQITCVLVGLTATICVAQKLDDRTASYFDGPGVVLLKHDTYHIGHVRQLGGQVQIELANNAKVTHATSQIAFIGRDLEEVYQHKRNRNKRLEVGDHFQLTRWCLRAGLLAHAAEHYLEVTKVAAKDPRVKQLGIELREKLLADAEFRKYVGLAPAAAPKTDSIQTEALHSGSEAFVQSAGAQSSPSIHPLVVSQYSERIQPILINRCSQAACHGFNSNNRLKLFEPKGRNAARITGENLRQVMALLSQTDPMETELVKRATHAHSMQQEPAIAPAETAILLAIQSWINFAQNPVVTANGQQSWPSPGFVQQNSRSYPTSNSNGLKAVAPGSLNLRAVPHGGQDFIGASSDQAAAGDFQPPAASELDQLDARLREILGESPAESGGVVPSDPFDPAIFNRRVRQQQTSPANR